MDEIRSNLDEMLRRTIKTMQDKDSNSATVTLKIGISLSQIAKRDENTPADEPPRLITVPQINHQISSAMQIKEKMNGQFGGTGYELVYNDLLGDYVIVPSDGSQTNIFNTDTGEVLTAGEDSDTHENI
jgi:hypothetical protein